MVYATGAHQTNVASPESVEHLGEKCKNMQRTGSRWQRKNGEKRSTRPAYENYTEEKRLHPELAAFEKAEVK